MTNKDKIIFYNAEVCPYAHRAAIALKEVGAEYEEKLIDLRNKPDWYKDVNPEGKVPALEVEGQNIAESLVIIEYINDRWPEKKLLPEAPLQRANARFAIEYFGSKINAETYKLVSSKFSGESSEESKNNLNASLSRFGELLKQASEEGPYFFGEQFSLVDIAIAPFILRLNAFNKIVLEGFEFEAVEKNPRLSSYFKEITDRTSVKDTYLGDDVYIGFLKKRFA